MGCLLTERYLAWGVLVEMLLVLELVDWVLKLMHLTEMCFFS